MPTAAPLASLRSDRDAGGLSFNFIGDGLRDYQDPRARVVVGI